MTTIIAFGIYASTAGKAERLSEYVGHTVTIGTATDEAQGTLTGVTLSEEEGWLAHLSGPGIDHGYGWMYLSDITHLCVEGA